MGLVDIGRRIIGWNAEPAFLAGLRVPLQAMHRGLLLLIGTLVPLNLVVGWLKWMDYGHDQQPLAFFRYFDLGEEQVLPAWVASTLLVVASVTAAAAAQRSRHDPTIRRGFLIVAAALAYASLDEATYLHERSSEPLRDSLGLGGAFYWAWVLPALLVVGVLARVLWPFIGRLPPEVRRDMLIAAALFVGCAVGIEMIDALVFSVSEEASAATELLTIVEECGEMLAVMFFISTSLRYSADLTATPVIA